jgi:hypothetical protein
MSRHCVCVPARSSWTERSDRTSNGYLQIRYRSVFKFGGYEQILSVSFKPSPNVRGHLFARIFL